MSWTLPCILWNRTAVDVCPFLIVSKGHASQPSHCFQTREYVFTKVTISLVAALSQLSNSGTILDQEDHARTPHPKMGLPGESHLPSLVPALRYHAEEQHWSAQRLYDLLWSLIHGLAHGKLCCRKHGRFFANTSDLPRPVRLGYKPKNTSSRKGIFGTGTRARWCYVHPIWL